MALLDLDVARYAAGWGRIKYVNDQLIVHELENKLPEDQGIPIWNSDTYKVRNYPHYFNLLEERDVFFSYPMDLDFAMLLSYPEAYKVVEEEPDTSTLKAVLGKSHYDSSQYSENELKLFSTYHQRFKLGSKPASHIDALARLSDAQLLVKMPESLNRLADAVINKLMEFPE